VPAQNLGISDGESSYHHPQKGYKLNSTRDRAKEGNSCLGKLDAKYVSHDKGKHANQAGASHPVKPLAGRIGKSFQTVYFA